MIQRIFVASLGLLLLCSAGAFFLLVPLLSILTVGSMLAALMLMFGLGFQTGSREMIPAVTTHGHLTAFGYPRKFLLQLRVWKSKSRYRSHDEVA